MNARPTPTPAAIERRRRVFQAVRDLLAEQGFRISMDAVAARAGCSKQTLYSQFGSKQALLHALMREHIDVATTQLDDSHCDPRTALYGFALEHLERLADPLVIASCQLFSAEAEHFPEQARDIFRNGAEQLMQRLQRWIDAAMRSGLLRHDDPHYAAELLLSMIVGMDFERLRFAAPGRSLDARKAWAGFAVDQFLRAFAPASPPPLPAAAS